MVLPTRLHMIVLQYHSFLDTLYSKVCLEIGLLFNMQTYYLSAWCGLKVSCRLSVVNVAKTGVLLQASSGFATNAYTSVP